MSRSIDFPCGGLEIEDGLLCRALPHSAMPLHALTVGAWAQDAPKLVSSGFSLTLGRS
jgi:hypothetical protein